MRGTGRCPGAAGFPGGSAPGRARWGSAGHCRAEAEELATELRATELRATGTGPVAVAAGLPLAVGAEMVAAGVRVAWAGVVAAVCR